MKPPLILLPPRYRRNNNFAVRYQTFLCDAAGNVERPLQSGWNMITDFGMDNLATTAIGTLIDYLHVGSSTETMKRILSGGVTISFDDSDPTTVVCTASSNFFDAADVGRTLKCDGVPEMLVTGYTSALIVTCKARAGVWHPSYTPVGAVVSGAAGIHYTNDPDLAAEFTRFNSKDTGAANNDAEITDSSNSRINIQKIFLSSVVSGSPWTINQLGWGTNTVNCFGKANLASPDAVAVGKRYRVQLNVYYGFTPIDLAAQTVNWGGTVGSYTCDIRQERIGFPAQDGNSLSGAQAGYNFLRVTTLSGNTRVGYWTASFTLQTVQWLNDAGATSLHARTGRNEIAVNGNVYDSSYTTADFRKIRTVRWDESVTITAATALYANPYNGTTGFHYPALTVKPTSGTITKASGFRVELLFPIIWQRELLN